MQEEEFVIMLTQVVSLWWQVILYIVGHLEEFSPEALAFLPASLRCWLFLHLPLADVCLLEGTSMSIGLDMEQIWEELYKARLLVVKEDKTTLHNKLTWKEQYCHDLWICVNKHRQPRFRFLCGVDIERQLARKTPHWTKCHRSSLKHLLLTQLFGASLNIIQTIQQSANIPIFDISQVTCDTCVHIMICPRRYVHHCRLSEKPSFLKTTSYFWIYFRNKPDFIRLTSNALPLSCSGLSQLILTAHPDVLTVLCSRVNSLDIETIYERDTVLNAVIACVNIPLKLLKVNFHFTCLQLLHRVKSSELILYGLSQTPDFSIQPLLSNHLVTLTICLVEKWCKAFSQLVTHLFTMPNFRELSLFNNSLQPQDFHEIFIAFAISPLPLTLGCYEYMIYEEFPNLLEELPKVNNTLKNLDLKFKVPCDEESRPLHIPALRLLEILPLQSLVVGNELLHELASLKRLNVQVLKIDCLFSDYFFEVLTIVLGFQGISRIELTLNLTGLYRLYFLDVRNIRSKGGTGHEVVQQFLNILNSHQHHNLCSISFDEDRRFHIDLLTFLLEGVMMLHYLRDLTLDFKKFETSNLRPVYDAWMKCARGRKMKKLCFKEVIDLSMEELSEIAEEIEGTVANSSNNSENIEDNDSLTIYYQEEFKLF